PARTLALLARRIEHEMGITVSIGLSYNKFLAKVASDLDKPRGFAVIGRGDANSFLADKPVGLLWGVGAAMQRRLAADGIALIGQLRALDDREMARRYGKMGLRLAHLARGEDSRQVEATSRAKSISAETTFAHDESDEEALARTLWPLCEQVSARLKSAGLAAGTTTLKLKTSDFRIRTRSRKLADPTQLADTLFRTTRRLLAAEAEGTTRFRLIGVGADALVSAETADLPTLFDQEDGKPRRLEQAMDDIRERLGKDAVRLGRVVD
ncbi:MAG TPA: DNA polymerase IV, partial [Stellaceae bacterium]|nr:DNA polymerase IV [Stellaceae bacterium]